MLLKELKSKLACIDGNAVVQFGDYTEYDIGDIVVTIGADGTTVLLKEAKKKTDTAQG